MLLCRVVVSCCVLFLKRRALALVQTVWPSERSCSSAPVSPLTHASRTGDCAAVCLFIWLVVDDVCNVVVVMLFVCCLVCMFSAACCCWMLCIVDGL